ncbi:MAG: glycosyltransferase [Alphaproteobacteria bacterium]|nr:glycosyltransferase [Alphaproteobacteria bacterium]MBU2270017.1 glycosyltransferase [Alphaproteobacteria bacterium]MBU2417860.1 glycosyltransferase [Alphaproteobacteria bacterium]
MKQNTCMSRPVWSELAIGVPVYSRPNDLRKLLAAVASSEMLPAEVVLCDDMSPERAELRAIAEEWTPALAQLGCEVRFIENDRNLGYDGNLRKVIASARAPWVCLLGNDDFLLPAGVAAMQSFVLRRPEVKVVSRAHVRVQGEKEVGVSRLWSDDAVFDSENSQSGMLFRLAGFVGGLMINRPWADGLSTDRYDGTLYYQIHLAAHAYVGSGIGYISTPTVGGRTDGLPLFGSAGSEQAVHIPGSYTPKGRAAMWRGVLRIGADVENEKGVTILPGLRRELTVKQSFHVFEMMTVQKRGRTLELTGELRKLGLMGHPMPWILAMTVLVFGRWGGVFFRSARSVFQHR